MKILINEIWEKIHLTCFLLSGQRGSGKGQGGQEVTSPPDEVSSLYIRNSFKTAISFVFSHKPREDLRTSLSITIPILKNYHLSILGIKIMLEN